jgi:hypothetical protein
MKVNAEESKSQRLESEQILTLLLPLTFSLFSFPIPGKLGQDYSLRLKRNILEE